MILLGISLTTVQTVGIDSVLVYQMGGWRPPIGIALVIDSLTSFMLVTVNLIAFAIAIYARAYMERYTSKELFYTLFLLMLAGMNGVILAGDLFNLFVLLEVSSLSGYALIAMDYLERFPG